MLPRKTSKRLTACWTPLKSMEKEAHTLLLQPLMGRARPELADRVRSWPTSTPYILFYLTDDDGITGLRVLHHARDVRLLSFGH
jgi:toxin ParE1/3/4